jgi:crotonobetainyl-CoA:carnitine CoA-transferase CaiB-like acyl-CoA transferase
MLTGYRIIELGSHIAAPAAAGILSDWGAEVIKIEPRQGDPIRWQRPPAEPNGSSPNFEFDNRGKRSISIDLRQAEARDILHRLIGAADVFISNLRPAPLARAGLDYLTLEALNPRLVYTSVTGFGLEGPAADLPAFDLTAFWARSGLSGQMWPPGTAPASWRPGVGDHICALTAALGTVTALLERVKTGRGRLVECSLLHAGTYVGGFDLAEQLRQGTTMPARRRDEETSRPSCDFALGSRSGIRLAQDLRCRRSERPRRRFPFLLRRSARRERPGPDTRTG